MSDAPRPYTLIAELTYRCPLRCAYCSNPVVAERAPELDTAQWIAAFRSAEELGVMQLHLTGGEPLLRTDLEELVTAAGQAALFTNHNTSGGPPARARLEGLAKRGLDNVQLSVQALDDDTAYEVAGYRGTAQKLEVARWVKELGLPLTLNFVLHKRNLDQVDRMIDLAEALRADRLELANTQYLGWALLNRDALLPTREMLERARASAEAAMRRFKGKMDVAFVMPDYFSDRPKACMDGWARRYVHMDPTGLVLPCHAAASITTLQFERVGERSLEAIWRDSPALNAYRGDAWMPDLCKGCERKNIDFGGCRCQAFALAGDAAATDPACGLAPAHGLIETARASATAREGSQAPLITLRTPPRVRV